jgi:hypothetical protein
MLDSSQSMQSGWYCEWLEVCTVCFEGVDVWVDGLVGWS